MQVLNISRWAIMLISLTTLFFIGCENSSVTEPDNLNQEEITTLRKGGPESIMKIKRARRDKTCDFIPDLLGETVTIKGVVTTPNFRDPNTQGESHFIQDNSGGIEFFSAPGISPALEMGDKVVVTGVIEQHRGSTVIHLYSASDIQIIGTKTIKRPKKIRASRLADQVGERIEGKLVKLKGVRLVDGYEFPPEGWWRLIRVVDLKGDTANVFIDNQYDIDGSDTPSGTFNLTGVATQYTLDTPADNNYQIVPRGLFDIE